MKQFLFALATTTAMLVPLNASGQSTERRFNISTDIPRHRLVLRRRLHRRMIEGDRCECDDPGFTGFVIVAPSAHLQGGVLGGLYLF